VGRTARGEGSSGHALLILRPEELGFLRYLKEARVPVNEYEFSWNKIADIQLQVRVICNVNVNVNGNISVSIIFTNNINADFMLFSAREADIEKLLLMHVGERGVQELRQSVRFPSLETGFRYRDSGSGESIEIVWIYRTTSHGFE